ncbi:MAG: Rieske 2Fe-2S domain-containing protein [Chitinophagales bacterium]|nr:Rieske 2Fe-2S domain-containing protein [Chitinophagales bacterium]MDW8427941.1 Rieske 2Fe-2S domain-containing protein [Chitinophagales bacterium]
MRRLLLVLVVVWLGLGLWQCEHVDSQQRVDFYIDLTDPQYQDLYLTGGYVYVNNIIVFKGLDQNYYALSQYCTNDVCVVQYQVSFNEVVCTCDQSHFDIYGNPTFGPATYPLYRYATSLHGSMLRIYTP